MTRVLIALAIAVALLAGAATAGAAVDPAVVALRDGDVYASPRALGPDTPEATERLQEAADDLNGTGRPVKLAVVLGPVGAPSMRAYTRDLRRRLGYDGTLAVTSPGRGVVVVGPDPPATVTRRLRAARVASIRDPVDRVITAASAAAPPSTDDGGGGPRLIAAFLGIAILGAAWAVAWGLRRERRGRRGELAEARGYLSTVLDATRERAGALGARPDLPDDARAQVDRALVDYANALAALRGADTVTRIEGVLPPTRSALASLADAASAVGERLPADEPFRGLCAVDPAHGPATAHAVVEGRGEAEVCSACASVAADGEALVRRMLPTPVGPVPFDEMSAAPLAGEPEHAATGAA